jgi:hypothetical protein
MIAAFIYDGYEQRGIRDSFRGVFSDLSEVLKTIVGDPDDNLETMDLETREFRIFCYRDGKWERSRRDPEATEPRQ